MGRQVTALKAMLERKDEALLVEWNRGVREDIAGIVLKNCRKIKMLKGDTMNKAVKRFRTRRRLLCRPSRFDVWLAWWASRRASRIC